MAVNINVLVIGDVVVGKGSLLIKYISGTFSGRPLGPIIEDCYRVTIAVNGCRPVEVELLQVAVVEEFSPMRGQHYRRADVVLICFSLVDHRSYVNVSERFHHDLVRISPNTPIVLAGTKLDLRDEYGISSHDHVTYEQGLKMMEMIGAVKYVECSARTGEGVSSVIIGAVCAGLRLKGFTGESAYLLGMEEGYVHLNCKKLVLMGAPCVGKTAFKSLLFNWPAPRDHHSTAIASRPIRAMERITDRNEDKVWDVVESKEVMRMLTDAIKATSEDPTPSSGQLPHFDNPSTNMPLEEDASINSTTASTTIPTVPEPVSEESSDGSKERSTVPTHDYSEDIIKLMRKEKKSKELHKATWIHVLDSGGQPQFADISRAFLRGNALNIIVIKLTEKLSDKPQFAYSLNGKAINAPSELAMTNIQLIEHFVRSVAASKSTTVRIDDKEIVTKPFFIVIGTYFDQATKGIFTKREVGSESIANKNRQILSVLHEFREHFIFYNDASEELIFPVDNLCRINRKKISAQIRERIMSQEGVGFRVPIPVRWYIFELQMREMASSEEHGIISLQSCHNIGKKLNISREEVKASLKYLDSLTLCLYYDKLLPNVIFTNPQYLLDLLSNVVRVSFVTVLDKIVPEGQSLSTDTQRLLRENGVFEESLLDVLKLPFVSSLFQKEDFLKLLRYIRVIAPLISCDSVQRYYMPIVLSPDQLHLTEDDKQVLMGTCDPVIIEFKMKFLPQGIFPSLVVSLVGRKENPHFFIDSRSPTFPRQLRYAVKLYSNDLCGSVLLLDRFKYIEVYFTGFPTGCPALYDAIQKAIVSCGQLLGYNETQLETNVTLSCQRAHRLTNTTHSLIMTQHNGQLYGSCTSETELPPLLLTDRQLCWLNDTASKSSVTVSHYLPTGTLDERHAPVILSSLVDLVDEWECLGIHLGLENSILQEIKYNSLHQVQTCRKEMIVRWLQGGTATRQRLISALMIMKRGDLVAKIQSIPTD